MCAGLHIRFAGLFKRLKIAPPSNLTGRANKDLGFDDDIFFMAAAFDPHFGFRWLEDLPDHSDAKEELRQYVIGILLCCDKQNMFSETYYWY